MRLGKASDSEVRGGEHVSDCLVLLVGHVGAQVGVFQDVAGGVGVAGGHVDDRCTQVADAWRGTVSGQVESGQAETGPERCGVKCELGSVHSVGDLEGMVMNLAERSHVWRSCAHSHSSPSSC